MKSHRKLELSRETLRCLTWDVPWDKLVDVRGGVDQSLNTCLDCEITTFNPPPTWECAATINPPPTLNCF